MMRKTSVKDFDSRSRVRPSSASANLQSGIHDSTPLFDQERPITPGVSAQGRPRTQAGAPMHYNRITRPEVSPDESRHRRLTLAAVDGVGESVTMQRLAQTRVNTSKNLRGKIEEQINIGTLDLLKRAFAEADQDGNAQLELEEFKSLIKQQLRISANKDYQIESLFHKIDWSSDGSISWDEFCTYMQLEYAEKEDHYRKSKEVDFILPAIIKHTPHKDAIVKTIDIADGSFMVCSREGLVSFWTPNVELKKTKFLSTGDLPLGVKSSKSKWFSDMTIMTQYNKLLVGTGDREIQFYELSSFDPYCQINSLETVPLTLDYSSLGDDHCIILFGDGDGCINIFDIHSAGENLRTWKKKPRKDNMPTVGLDVLATSETTRFIRWQVHNDWIQQMKYYPEIRQVISCSNHQERALVIGSISGSTDVNQQLRDVAHEPNSVGAEKVRSKTSVHWLIPKPRLAVDEQVFAVYKGVKCFDFSKRKNVLITGGMDRIVRLWNPYVTAKPIAMLRGHSKPISFIAISEEDDRIFSVSTDITLRVWDVFDQNCLTAIRPKMHKIKGEVRACCYSPLSKTLMIATDQMNGITLRQKQVRHADIPVTHRDPIRAIVYNTEFDQLITSSDGSIIKVWDLDTGTAIFEFGNAHSDEAVTCLTFDLSNRRLISGGRDGCIRLWNYNNGHCLRTLSTVDKNPAEISALTYTELSKNRYIISVGWDKKVNIYTDIISHTITTTVQHPLPYWSDDINKGHKDDVLSVAVTPPNLLATSSYDGEVIIWNLISGHIFCKLRNLHLTSSEEQQQDGDLAINKILFLKTRAYQKDNASLVTSGPKGHIHFWTVYNGGILRAYFRGCNFPWGQVTVIETNKDNSLLFSADNYGFICIWKIKDYAYNKAETDCPPLEKAWRGHVENVTSLSLIEHKQLLVTASLDCTVRMWNFQGEYIGTFGQPDPWDIYNRSTFQHPMVPYDVLVDPLSIPNHPVLAEKYTLEEITFEPFESTLEDTHNEDSWTTTASFSLGRPTNEEVMDVAVQQKMNELIDRNAAGKRLRHEVLRPHRVDRGGPNDYQMLRCFPIVNAPMPHPPKTSGAGKNPDSFSDLNEDYSNSHSSISS